MNKNNFNLELIDIAKNSIYVVHPIPLRFHFLNGCIAGNLVELIDCIRYVDQNTLLYHLFRLVDENNTVTPRSDLSLWIHYVLKDTELSAKIYELRNIEDPVKLRKNALQTCEARYFFFKDILASLI